MSREIRITIDDDEVFERMKGRKQALDLSWEEVLHRGLRRSDPANSAGAPGQTARDRSPRAKPPRPDPVADPAGFAEELKHQIKSQVSESLQDSFGRELDPLASDVATLQSAEDAILRFEFLGESGTSPSAQVPLRVTLEAGSDGLAIDVVSIREGKTVTDMNAFDPTLRQQIIEGLAQGALATLSIEGGEESYSVVPTLSWSRAEGLPTITDVTVEEVRFDDS